VRIALVGTRGPGFYGGFETCVAELAPRLAAMGHDVTVYARRWSAARHWRSPGVRVVTLPSVPTKSFDTITHTAVCTAHLAVRRCDVAIFFGVGNSMWARALQWFGVPVVLNVDGLDRARAKWGRFARWFLHRSERWSLGARTVVTDAKVIETYYREEYGRDSLLIPYGSPDRPEEATDEVVGRGFAPDGYILYVSRLEPENNAHVLIDAYARASLSAPLVVVGGSAYDDSYEKSLHDRAGSGVHFLGFVFGAGYRQLQSHAALYVQCTEVGGTHPALVEAMGFGNAVVALDTPEHREVLGDCGKYYRTEEELAAALTALMADDDERKRLAGAALDRARQLFSWDAVARAYDEACRAVASG
jgi:glycosyltransferase involved in cell wall biosynthesis